MWEKA
jgi:hypothetical protein